MPHADIDEIFTSIQGEGPWIGERQIFVRFRGCNIHCVYCDTPAALGPSHKDGGSLCTVQTTFNVDLFEQVRNPLSEEVLTNYCRRLRHTGVGKAVISLTGGEPLLQHDFLAGWLPQIRDAFSVYLESNGILFREMERIAEHVDRVSMDLKLPSSTGQGQFWGEHREFLQRIRGRSAYAKAVVTSGTTEEDVCTAAGLLAEANYKMPLVLQPATGRFAPEIKTVLKFQRAALAIFADVRIIPQVHPYLQVR